ncbi:bifunctional diguanylate cyclase/phosphodiesterase [Mycobacterium cookii]|uniref:Bifunctional diguanylate cyclase/phosphodiesterase n=1 Tax=Mycobacterium cookii TaxID=1775 RepID=A0A7I7KX73_9MYCO|nr:bifunctional diguanylate cyclase/phosphodiesterase [Mycobacterium cookii]MCV7332741.1 bifunctional diguanylate cyclase/phosphodiesterase [Mycobacterium cookii]BBX46108.1 bifunctional diguanylate cyclase/phosphodiesterase [Mycobacterium cookii]
MAGNLGLITSIANRLLEATATTATQASEQVLAQLVDHFDLRYAFLRYSDHDKRTSVLAAEWPPRPDVADPDPFAVLPFASSHPVLALCENGKDLVTVHHDFDDGASPCPLVQRGPGGAPAVAAAPLIAGAMTVGVLGFVKGRSRKWKSGAINTLETTASLFAQFQARISAEQRLRHLVEHDDLTGLRNRRSLLAYLSDRLAVQRPGPVALLYIDLDHLKAINDSFGHTAGDWFIRDFADRLRDCAGSQSMVARLGGDEFVVVPDEPMSAHAAASLADRMCRTLHGRLVIESQTVTRTVSVGVAAGTPGRDDGGDLLRRADEAVLASKRAGGDRFTMASANSLKQRFRSDIERHLQGDIDHDSLLLHYLPEVDLWTGAIVATEALVRWRHPDRGVLLPDSFIGVAESMDLAAELDRWVLRTACEEFGTWRSRGLGQGTSLRVNVSPLQLTTPGFIGMVAETIADFDMADGSLCLEVTERAVVHDIDNTTRTLGQLKDIGVQTSIDDFGSGRAVLSHLQTLPVDALKIDPRFVRELGTNANDLAVVRAIIGLAEAFDLQLIAEGVETPAAALELMRHGCRRAQGYLISRPVTGDVMASLLSSRGLPMPFLANSKALTTEMT